MKPPFPPVGLLVVVLCLGLASACAHPAASGPAPATPAASEPAAATGPGLVVTPAAAPGTTSDLLGRVRVGVDELLSAQGQATWKGWTTGAPLDLAAAWTGREWLASAETLSALADARDGVPAAERPGVARLRAYLLGEHLARQAAGPTRALAAARAAATFSFDKRAVPLRDLETLLAAEAAAPRRQALAAARAAAVARLAPRIAARDAALVEAARALGFDGTLGLAAELHGEEPGALAALAEATLERTEATWHALLEALSRQELQTPLSRLRERDLPRLLRSTAPAAPFPADRLLPEAEATLAGLGLDLAAGGHLTVDVATRPGKPPRPLCVPVEVPTDVRLSLAPLAGLEAWRALLHEVGAAQAAARVSATAPLEDRRLAPAALSEAWGILLASLTGTPAWLLEHGLATEAARREVRVAAARRLHAARLAAARLLAEIDRAREPAGAAGAAGRWPALAARAFGHPVDRSEPPPWTTDPDPLLHAAEALRAELLSAQAELALDRQAGPGAPWWRSREAGARLTALWAQGGRLTPDEAAGALGAPRLDPSALDELVRARAAAGGVELPAPAAPAPSTTPPAGAAPAGPAVPPSPASSTAAPVGG